MKKRIFIIAGEPSGDLHGANLVRSIKEIDPDIDFIGIGGDRMKREGIELVEHCSNMAVVGFTEVFTKLANIIKTGIKTKRILLEKKPDLLILIDYPDFNLHIAGYAKRLSIPVMYYISPQVWAWRTGRVKKIRKLVDKMVVILPFEKEFYERWGVDVSYVGHPIMDEIPKELNREEIKERLGVVKRYPIISLLPGSRKHEIENTLPLMIDALSILKGRYNSLIAYIVVAEHINMDYIKKFTMGCNFIVPVPNRMIYEVLSISDMAFVTSGTATLETAIMETPMIVIYKGSSISFWIAKSLVNVKYISLANLIAKEKIVPEILQDQVKGEILAREALRILEDEGVRKEMKEKLKNIRAKLGEGGASKRAANIAISILKGSSHGKEDPCRR